MRPRVLVAFVVVGLLLGGCGSSTSHDASSHGPSSALTAAPTPSGATLGEANMADVTFVQMMLPHHEQALEMTKMARDRAADRRVLDLMVQMWDEQAGEIEQMQAMLAAWNVEPAPVHDMPGMVSDADMKLMSETGGAAFDEMFLTNMIAHHEGAIAMAQDVLASGSDPQVRALAESVITSQQAEVEEMKAILADPTD